VNPSTFLKYRGRKTDDTGYTRKSKTDRSSACLFGDHARPIRGTLPAACAACAVQCAKSKQ